MADGYVVKVESPTVYMDWGKATGVQVSDRFDIYRTGTELKHPVTGEVLGKAEETLAKGFLERVEEKFSIGHLLEAHGALQPGDRTRYVEAKGSAVMGSGPSLSGPLGLTPSPKQLGSDPGTAWGQTPLPGQTPLAERWRSDAMPDEAVGMTLADVDGDGQKEIVVAFRTKIKVFRWTANHLETLATYEDRHYRHWLAIEAADLDHKGREELFATVFQDGLSRPRVVILRWENGGLKPAGDLEGFVRSVERLGGSLQLLWQSMSRTRDLHFIHPAELRVEKNAYQPGPPLKLPRLYDEQLFGFAFGDWDADGSEDMAILVNGERLRMFFKGVNWSSSEVYGGTKNDFSFSSDQVGSFLPRLLSWQPAGGKPQLLVSHNIPELGIRLTYLKLYKKSEIVGLSWNGLEMSPAWTLPVAGYLADFTIGNGLRESTPQLWAATVGPGDKTVLLAYSLP